ncbi:MAG: capsule assembly Wzi family protein [Syntrophobacteraceae bacterium]
MRPYTRIETARLVAEAIRNRDEQNLKLPPLIEYYLDRFQKEFAEELAVYGRGQAGSGAKFVLTPVEEATAAYVFVDGRPRDFVNFGGGFGQFPKASGSGIIATEPTPLLPNNDGIAYNNGSNFSFRFASSFRLWDVFSGYVEPIFIARQNDNAGRDLAVLSGGQVFGRLGERDHVEVDLHRGYAKLSEWNIEIEAGRDSLWFGQGHHGTLMFTNNAVPLDILKLSNPTPTILPWYLCYLGPVKYTAFAARLENDRDFPHAILAGGRAVIKPHPLLELGMTGVLTFGGEGAGAVGIPGETGQEDGRMALDMRLRLPFLRNAEFYAEYAGEDILTDSPYWYEPFMNDIAWLVGIYFPRLFDDGSTDLRVEYSNNAFDQGPGHGGIWYGHSQFTSGYTYEQAILGHRMGPDAHDIFARVTHHLRSNLILGVDYEHMERGVTVGLTEEKSNIFGADVTYDYTEHWRLMVRYGFESIDDFNLVPGQNRDNHLLMTAVKFTF